MLPELNFQLNVVGSAFRMLQEAIVFGSCFEVNQVELNDFFERLPFFASTNLKSLPTEHPVILLEALS
jgi:hypothetical protein